MIYEAQSRETISDSLKIGCVPFAGMGQSSMTEHLWLSHQVRQLNKLRSKS